MSDKVVEKPIDEEEKALLIQEIVNLRNNGKTYRQIGEILDMDKTTVRRWFLKYDEREE